MMVDWSLGLGLAQTAWELYKQNLKLRGSSQSEPLSSKGREHVCALLWRCVASLVPGVCQHPGKACRAAANGSLQAVAGNGCPGECQSRDAAGLQAGPLLLVLACSAVASEAVAGLGQAGLLSISRAHSAAAGGRQPRWA